MKKIYYREETALTEAEWVTSELAKIIRKSSIPVHDIRCIREEILTRYGLYNIGRPKCMQDVYLNKIKETYTFQLGVCDCFDQPIRDMSGDFASGECFTFFTICDEQTKVITLWFIGH